MADSEDEFFMHNDKVMLEEPVKKRGRRQQEEDEFLQASDEEVLGYSESSSGAEEGDNGDDEIDLEDTNDAATSEDLGSSVDEQDVEMDSMAGWGSSKAAYYDADKITNEEEALAEEEEARRLQRKQLQSLQDADFGFDEIEWAAGEDASEEEKEKSEDPYESGGVIKEKLPELQILPDMNDTDKLKLLRRRYPTVEEFARELVELQPLWRQLQDNQKSLPTTAQSTEEFPLSLQEPTSRVQFRALSAYLGGLAMYFAVLTSSARDASISEETPSLPLLPQEVRDHEVVEYVRRCRTLWEMAVDLPSDPETAHSALEEQPNDFDGLEDSTLPEAMSTEPSPSKTEKPDTAQEKRVQASTARRAARLASTQADLVALQTELARPNKQLRPLAPDTSTNDMHDLGDEPILDARTAAEKAQRRKSLRFYTSRIAQKANKDAKFADAAGGDDDLPYRERWRDKVERLNREAEARGRQGKEGNEPDDEDESEGHDIKEITNAEREAMDQDDDYAEFMGYVNAKKEKKRQREDAYRTAHEQGGRVERIQQDGVGPHGRREIGYAIAKNKGLTPKRKKEIRNPRVKKRLRFEEKKKKLRSMKPSWKGGEGRGGYGGELTGIKTGLVKGVKF